MHLANLKLLSTPLDSVPPAKQHGWAYPKNVCDYKSKYSEMVAQEKGKKLPDFTVAVGKIRFRF